MKTIDEMVAVLTAAKEGKQIQIRKIGDVAWADCAPQIWNWAWYDYRIAPDPEPEPPKVEPWTFETSPLHRVHIRRKHDGKLAATAMYPNGVIAFTDYDTSYGNIHLSYAELARDWEQLDGAPCGVVREPESKVKWYTAANRCLWSVEGVDIRYHYYSPDGRFFPASPSAYETVAEIFEEEHNVREIPESEALALLKKS